MMNKRKRVPIRTARYDSPNPNMRRPMPPRPPAPGSQQRAPAPLAQAKPQSAENKKGEMPLRVIPLGGVEEIGKNITVIEYGDDIIVVDMGFAFPDENMPGIDYVIPDTKYLEERKKNIRGVLFTHGHLDHIGATPYILPKRGDPPIYTMRLTAAMIEKRL